MQNSAMKKNIVKLRILGMISFLLYFLSFLFKTSKISDNNFMQIQQLLIIIALGSFAIVMGLQIYRFYINTYLKEDDEDT